VASVSEKKLIVIDFAGDLRFHSFLSIFTGRVMYLFRENFHFFHLPLDAHVDFSPYLKIGQVQTKHFSFDVDHFAIPHDRQLIAAERNDF